LYSCSVTVTSGHEMLFMPLETVGGKWASASKFRTSIIGGKCRGPLSALEQANHLTAPFFSGNCSTGLLKVLSLAVRQYLWFQECAA
jgi:hypothetical protein